MIAFRMTNTTFSLERTQSNTFSRGMNVSCVARMVLHASESSSSTLEEETELEDASALELDSELEQEGSELLDGV